MTITQTLDRLGGIARTVELERLGHTEASIRWAVRCGLIAVVRGGWVRTNNAPDAVVRAVESGGRLGCVSAAHHLGLWTMPHSGLHVAVPSHAGRSSAAIGLVRHWTSATWGQRSEPIEAIDQVIRQMLLCCDRDAAIVAIDSALNQRMLSLHDLGEILRSLPSEFADVLSEVDGRSQSGLETIPRVRLRRLGIPVATQVRIAGVGTVDVVVGERLIIESDGREWHDNDEQFVVDRSRDLATAQRGYVTLRPTASHILDEWQWFESVVLAMVARGEHRWSRAHRLDPRSDGYGG
jgi:very-short-patch-repair endonuclease